MAPMLPSRVAAPDSSLYWATTSAKDVPSLSLPSASSARRHACSRVRVTVAGAPLAPTYLTSTCFTLIRSGSEALRSCFASASARQRSAALPPADRAAGGGGEVGDEAPPGGAPPHATVVATTSAPNKVWGRRGQPFMDPKVSRLFRPW